MPEWDVKEAAEITERVINLLVGKTVKAALVRGHSNKCDSINVLELIMDDNTHITVTGTYGGYTGKSCDEYIELIEIS